MNRLFGSNRSLFLPSPSFRSRRRTSKAQRSLPSIASASLERLEDRVMLSTLDLSGGAINYDGSAAANTLAVSQT